MGSHLIDCGIVLAGGEELAHGYGNDVIKTVVLGNVDDLVLAFFVDDHLLAHLAVGGDHHVFGFKLSIQPLERSNGILAISGQHRAGLGNFKNLRYGDLVAVSSGGQHGIKALNGVHAIYAAEGALFERTQKIAYANPRSNLKLGCNFFRYTASNTKYAQFFEKTFDFATLPFYPGRTAPEEGKFTYEYIDTALSYLLDKGITPKGHPLFFGHETSNPKWMFALNYEELRKAAYKIAYNHVSAYKDTVQIWDSMNEAHDWANCFELTQDQLVDLTKTTTGALRDANPMATSIVNICLPFAEYVAGRYNCYGSLPEKLRSPLAYFKTILEAGVDFDVVGIQLYFPARDMVQVNLMLDVFRTLGKPIHITEMGVNGGFRQKGNAGSSWSQLDMSQGTWHGGWNEHTQADWMEMFYTIAAARKEIQALTWWDFIEPSFSGNGAFLYENENPREMFFRLLALKDRIVTQ
ncbi:MAG: endo-1,4-beta-xylanase [Clostridia bacterium]|nr:endo-1,4-beta-xylanase [Clostridia bacterium]